MTEQRIGVVAWEMSHNPAGRALALASAYQCAGRALGAKVSLLGPCYDNWGGRPWGPLAGHQIPCYTFAPHRLGTSDANIFQAYYEFVAAHPQDSIHLVKPRGPAILLGLLYQHLHGAQVLIDCDDEELGFFNQGKSLDKVEQSVEAIVSGRSALPPLVKLVNKEWTHISIAMMPSFSALTVSNPALQQRYGGTVVGHSRSGAEFQPVHSQLAENGRTRQQSARAEFGIAEDALVVLFCGTPRKHKGLEQVAQALAAIEQGIMLVVGDFPDETLQQHLDSLLGTRLQCIPGQPYSALAKVTALGDITVLFQGEDVVSRFQVPAKISDALATGVIVLATEQPSLQAMFDAGALIAVNADTLAATLKTWLARVARSRCQMTGDEKLQEQRARARDYFRNELSDEVVGLRLFGMLNDLEVGRAKVADMQVPGAVLADAMQWSSTGAAATWTPLEVLREHARVRVVRVSDEQARVGIEKTSTQGGHAERELYVYSAFHARHAPSDLRWLSLPQVFELHAQPEAFKVIMQDVTESGANSIGEYEDWGDLELGGLLFEISRLQRAPSTIAGTHSKIASLVEAQVVEQLRALASDASSMPLRSLLPLRDNQIEPQAVASLREHAQTQALVKQAGIRQEFELLLKSVEAVAEPLNTALGQVPWVFAHNDLNRGNVFYDAEERRFVVIDWVTCGFSPVGSDIAQLVFPSFWSKSSRYLNKVADEYRIESKVIQQWLDAARDAHVVNLSAKDIWLGYVSRLLAQQLLIHLPRFAESWHSHQDPGKLRQIAQKIGFLTRKIDLVTDFLP